MNTHAAEATTTSPDLEDPRTSGQQPPFPEQRQSPPGLEAEMEPSPDYGESTYQGHGRLSGRVALVTGADSGIGRAVALAYAREGADVAVSYLDEHEDAKVTCGIVEEAGRRFIDAPGDIGDERYSRALVERTVDELGRLDILVNNAAHQDRFERFEDITPEEWHRTFDANIHAMFYLSQAAYPHLRPGSSIINTTSVQAYSPSANLLAYATTKGAILTFTKGLSQLLIEDGIRVNAVAPGPIWTPIIPASTAAEQTAEFGRQSPLGRPGQPRELAPVYVLLASDEASYITGTVYTVAGGMTLP
jgi:NAD(P)-dependent dehydrogenase (short-subunit alcohol dehydrogenase family)